MNEAWRAMIYNGNNVGAIIMDLLKFFEILNNNVVPCKLKAYGFDTNTLTLIQIFLSN